MSSPRLSGALLACMLLCCACRTPQPAWQPAPQAPAVTIHVYRTAIHSILSLPSEAHPGEVDEWSYGQKIWFYDTRSSDTAGRFATCMQNTWFYTTGFFAGIFWPSAGVVEMVHDMQAFDEREPERWRRTWTYQITPEKLTAMRTWLRGSYPTDAPPLYHDDGSDYHYSRRRYHVFYNCHHFIAGALKAGGIPASGAWFPQLFWHRLGTLEHAQRVIPPALPATSIFPAATGPGSAPTSVQSTAGRAN